MREEKTGRVGEMSDTEEQMGLLRDPQVPCVRSVTLTEKKRLTSKHLETQDTLEMKCSKLLAKLNP